MGWEGDRTYVERHSSNYVEGNDRSIVDADRTVEALADLVREMYLELGGSAEYAEWLANVENTFEEWELSL